MDEADWIDHVIDSNNVLISCVFIIKILRLSVILFLALTNSIIERVDYEIV